ncbi:MAG: hypothetical protein BGO32_00205 [Bacteroidetes bacterium 37-13]|nr:MAG: hypothetical protein BGO32_00205 [Bacteroidetes bacterium 37-13]
MVIYTYIYAKNITMQYRKNNQQIGENLNRMLWKQIPLFLLVLLSLVSCNKDDKPIKEPNQKHVINRHACLISQKMCILVPILKKDCAVFQEVKIAEF